MKQPMPMPQMTMLVKNAKAPERGSKTSAICLKIRMRNQYLEVLTDNGEKKLT
jgi:hypothetical protein